MAHEGGNPQILPYPCQHSNSTWRNAGDMESHLICKWHCVSIKKPCEIIHNVPSYGKHPISLQEQKQGFAHTRVSCLSVSLSCLNTDQLTSLKNKAPLDLSSLPQSLCCSTGRECVPWTWLKVKHYFTQSKCHLLWVNCTLGNKRRQEQRTRTDLRLSVSSVCQQPNPSVPSSTW